MSVAAENATLGYIIVIIIIIQIIIIIIIIIIVIIIIIIIISLFQAQQAADPYLLETLIPELCRNKYCDISNIIDASEASGPQWRSQDFGWGGGRGGGGGGGVEGGGGGLGGGGL